MVLVQSSFHTAWASLFEMVLELNQLDWNENELEHELELEDMKRTYEDFDKIWQLLIEKYKWWGLWKN